MKIEVDKRLCELNAQCAFVAPELFRIEGDALVFETTVPDNLRQKAKMAAKVCPQLAIKLVEE
jgi:ferredoxin